MAERGGFERGFGGRGRGDRGRGRGRPRGNRKDEEEKWVPCTKLGRLVQQVCFLQVPPNFCNAHPGVIEFVELEDLNLRSSNVHQRYTHNKRTVNSSLDEHMMQSRVGYALIEANAWLFEGVQYSWTE